MEVRDIGLHGAYILAPNGFYPATLLNLRLENQVNNATSISVCAQVGRKTPDGFSVSFFLRGFRERRLLAEFLAGVKRRAPEEAKVAAPAEISAAEQTAAEPLVADTTTGDDQPAVEEITFSAGASTEGEVQAPPELLNEIAEAAEMANRKPLSRRNRRGGGPRRPSDGGQALIEFALVLPLLFLLIVNVVNFGGMLYAWITVANAARVGTQYFITGPATIGAPARPTESAVQALVINDLKALPNALTSQVCVSTSLSATVSCNTGSAPASAPPPAETAEGTPPVTFAVAAVDVTYTYQPFIPLWDFTALRIHATLPPTAIHRQAVMRILQ